MVKAMLPASGVAKCGTASADTRTPTLHSTEHIFTRSTLPEY